MKKTIKPGVREEYQILCDVTDKPAVAQLAFDYYGGVHDCEVVRVDLCEEVAVEILNLLQSKYPQFKIEKRDPLVCPACGRSPGY
jgi:hypothetical protein